MPLFEVLDCGFDVHEVILRSARGRYIQARALNQRPPRGASLQGRRPQIGFGILISPRTGAIYRMIFESIGAADPRFDVDLVVVSHAVRPTARETDAERRRQDG